MIQSKLEMINETQGNEDLSQEMNEEFIEEEDDFVDDDHTINRV